MNNETYELISDESRYLGLKTGIYQILARPVAPRKIKLEESAVRLIPSDSKGNPEPTLLVLSRDLARQWKIQDTSKISVYKTETLATVNFDALGQEKRVLPTLSTETSSSTENLEDAQWRSPEDFFTDIIVLIEKTSQEEHKELFPGVREVKGQQTLTKRPVPILPIKSELLKYLDIDYLADNITISQKNNEIVVELKLRLHGVDGQGKDFQVKRHYKDDEIELRSNNYLPVLEVWPNFKADNWKFYYTYYEAGSPNEENTFYAEPYLESRKFLAQKPNRKPRQIWHSESLPTAMVCETYSRKLKSNIEIGCLLLNDLSSPELRPGVSWNIGVDFGTSSTNIYVRKSNEIEPSEVSFKNRLFQITQSSDDNRGDIVKYFFPPFEPITPFLTLFRPELNIADREQESKTPLLRGNIRYVKPGLSWNPDGKEIDVKSRFKWHFEAQPIEGFLEQLALQCLAEIVADGATEVKWYVSFPTVFEQNAKTRSETAWKNIIKLTQSVEITTSEEHIKKTESVASASFFNNKHRVPTEGVICIDIGGETSDISILGDGGIPRECSVRFAGERFFTDLLKNNPSVLKDLKFKTEDIERLKKSSKTDSFYSEIDSLIGMNKEELWRKLRQVSDLQNPDGKVYGLLHLITLGLSGLMFYAGLQLNDTKAERKLQDEQLNYLCLGGNGAWTLQWLGLGNFGFQSPQNYLFQQVLKTASGLEQDTDVEIILSQKPKAEVAYGLIVPTDKKFQPFDEPKVEISGENFKDDKGQPRRWNTKLTPQLLASGLKVPEQLSQLQQFIEVFNQYANTDKSYVREVKIDPYKNRIIKDMQERLNNFKTIGHQNINAVEPLFIIALRRLLEEETERWAKDWK